jgi:hypothetical protein
MRPDREGGMARPTMCDDTPAMPRLLYIVSAEQQQISRAHLPCLYRPYLLDITLLYNLYLLLQSFS